MIRREYQSRCENAARHDTYSRYGQYWIGLHYAQIPGDRLARAARKFSDVTADGACRGL